MESKTINVSQNAANLLKELKGEYTNGIILYLSSGCCDGSALLCYQKDDFKLGSSDILLGVAENVGIYTHKSNLGYLKDSIFTLDTTEGNGSEYSLEYGKDIHFVFLTHTCPAKQ